MEAGDPNNSAPWITLLVMGACALFFTMSILRVKRYANEPPYIEPKVPIIGHPIGLLQRKYYYYIDL